MRFSIRHILSASLLICYALVVIAGQFGILHSIFSTGSGNHDVETAKTSQPLESKQYFIQGKHLPLTIKVQVPSESVHSRIQFPNPKSFVYSNFISIVKTLPSFKFVRYLPRDPPVV